MPKITRFKDVPRFIRADSGCDYDLQDVPQAVGDMVEKHGLILDPDFQRRPVWSQKRQTKYVEFLLRGGESSRTIYFNKPSWHFSVPEGAYDDFVIVDGKQRLAAVMAFMSNRIRAFGSFRNEFTDRPPPRPISKFMRFNTNSLQTKVEVLEWYLQINEGGVAHSEPELDRVRRILAAEKLKARKEKG